MIPRFEKCVAIVRSLAQDPCGCINPMASLSIHVDESGKVDHKYDLDPTRKCLACKAREALAADGVLVTKPIV